MALVPMMVEGAEDQPAPEVFVAKCCTDQKGLLVRINNIWWLLRDTHVVSGQLATRAFRVAVCRGCYQRLTTETPVDLWPWQTDEQLEEHFLKLSREVSE